MSCYLLKRVAGAPMILQLFIGAFLVGLGGLLHVRGPAISKTDRSILEAVLRGKEAAVLRRLGLLGHSSATSSGT